MVGRLGERSARTADDLANRPPPSSTPNPNQSLSRVRHGAGPGASWPLRSPPGSPRRRSRSWLVTAFTGGSNGPKAHKHRGRADRPRGRDPPADGADDAGQPASRPRPPAHRSRRPSRGPTADWMGMQIVTSPAGVVISTVQVGSAADQEGFEPGDQIEEINGSGSATWTRSARPQPRSHSESSSRCRCFVIPCWCRLGRCR